MKQCYIEDVTVAQLKAAILSNEEFTFKHKTNALIFSSEGDHLYVRDLFNANADIFANGDFIDALLTHYTTLTPMIDLLTALADEGMVLELSDMMNNHNMPVSALREWMALEPNNHFVTSHPKNSEDVRVYADSDGDFVRAEYMDGESVEITSDGVLAYFQTDINQFLTPYNFRAHYVANGGCYCPRCGSTNIDGEGVNIEKGIATQEVSCHDCEWVWTDDYVLNGLTEHPPSA